MAYIFWLGVAVSVYEPRISINTRTVRLISLVTVINGLQVIERKPYSDINRMLKEKDSKVFVMLVFMLAISHC